MTGGDWERYSLELVMLRYRQPGEWLQRVPAEDQGDLGIEAFSSDGRVYQCYSPKEPTSLALRYDSQRDKLTTDIDKLIARQDRIQEIMHGAEITEYVFLVPLHDSKRLNEHAAKKTKLVRKDASAVVDDDFVVLIHTADDYPVERSQLVGARLAAVDLPLTPYTDGEVKKLEEIHSEALELIDAKLSKLAAFQITAAREAMRNRILISLENQSAIYDKLRNDYPTAFQEILLMQSRKIAELRTACFLTPLAPDEFLLAEIKLIRADLTEILGTTGDEADTLAWGMIASWLADCPLNFVSTTERAVIGDQAI